MEKEKNPEGGETGKIATESGSFGRGIDAQGKSACKYNSKVSDPTRTRRHLPVAKITRTKPRRKRLDAMSDKGRTPGKILPLNQRPIPLVHAGMMNSDTTSQTFERPIRGRRF